MELVLLVVLLMGAAAFHIGVWWGKSIVIRDFGNRLNKVEQSVHQPTTVTLGD